MWGGLFHKLKGSLLNNAVFHGKYPAVLFFTTVDHLNLEIWLKDSKGDFANFGYLSPRFSLRDDLFSSQVSVYRKKTWVW